LRNVGFRKKYGIIRQLLQGKALSLSGWDNAHRERLQNSLFLTGGTALSRFYFHHRFSDDLDYFVNNNGHFSSHVDLLFESFIKNQTRLNFTIDLTQVKNLIDMHNYYLELMKMLRQL